MIKELTILKNVRHFAIMEVKEILCDEVKFYVVTEVCEGGELYKWLLKNGKLTENDACYVIKQILQAINYMHQQGITHRDLKLQNILLVHKGHFDVKVTDFGFSSFFDPKKGLKDLVGTPLYMAPELLKEQKYNEKVDIWSIGIMAYNLLSGR